ncbi:CusA/CzcA family heavy metal efflux RND transporter [Phaeodactylibacter sp.]|uniref:CusA/CzcA family heavy metal efflux RND transporter n=1 Tax=Phaeodactylibacter sp. TaxID=1940289 RepID=UPI0025EA9DB8|nr:CusA/CzcA family heavy metal efflux RND transporter [Phaeodactylibacter sp.]MCI5092679.1 CusA/CzcA family heavy metal efflux RND transporter [Phaeodactylibacter sp.]
MFDKIIAYSIENKFVIGLLVVALIVWGVFSLRQLPIDAVPDITNNQVQVITISPTLATQEVEQFITTPVELALQNIQQLVEIRSISRFGLSVVTVVFEEDMDVYLSRQLVSEYLKEAESNIPDGLGTPEMAPISTGLGEIYQYVIRPQEGYEDKYSLTELRSIQDWIVSRQLSGIEGVVEVNTMGGFLKQYEVAVDPNLLKSVGISITDIFTALENSNENTGGAYIEKHTSTYYIRTNGIAQQLDDIGNIVVDVRNGRPILIKDVATVQFGKAPRYGALVRDGEEAVGGRVMMLKGANSAAVTERVKERVIQIEKSLPKGVIIEPYLVRDKLVSTAIGTVRTNLIEGGLIVIFILVLMLGNWRAGLIVASVIPLAMLFAVSMMNVFGISANLMSLGAIDFGLIVDGAVIIVESIVHRLQVGFAGQKLTQARMNEEVKKASIKIRSSAAFGEIIILMVYIPILALVGIEGKMFKPMAQTVMLAIGGALILSLTYVPMMSALFLNKKISDKRTIADRIIDFFQRLYTPVLNLALRLKTVFVLATVALFVISFVVFSRMGGEFIPTLDEGDLAMQQILPPGTSLSQSIEMSKIIQRKLLKDFPEIKDVVVNIGAAEIPTDPMPVEIGDYTLVMKPKSEWTSADNRQEMFEKIEQSLSVIPGVGYEFSQPIQLRFNELMTGSKADIAIKLYGQDLELLYSKAKEAEAVITQLGGVGTVNVEQTIGMPQIIINFKYDKMAQYGLQVKEVNQVVRAAFAGESAGIIYEGEKRFDLVVRMDEKYRNGIEDVRNLYITLDNGTQVPLTAVADVELIDAPMQISRENTNRRIVIGVNVGDTDVETLVGNIQTELDAKVELPAGYYFTYGGQFENLKAANARLAIAVPLALALIFILLFFTFGSVSQAALIFTAIPLSAIGGIWALELRGMPFSISAGIGFIALFGVAVLNGIVLIGYFNQLKKEGVTNIRERIIKGTSVRLRPVLLTASVASLGFLPMALSNSGGAEVQRPLATVVIGGLITATFLTLVVLPILYSWLAQWQERKGGNSISPNTALILLPMLFFSLSAEAQQRPITMNEAVEMAVKNHPSIRAADLQIQQGQSLENLPYSLGDTEISYQGDGLFRKNGQQVNQIGIVQNIPNPASIKAQNSWQNEQVTQSVLQKQLTEKELRLQVQQIYLDLQQRKELRKLYESLVQTYQQYAQIAKVRTDVGAANRMELLTIQSSLNEYSLLVNQVKLEIANLEKQLAGLLNTNEAITSTDSLVLIPFAITDSINSFRVQLANQQIQIEQAYTDVLQARLKPDFNLGYAAQNYLEDGWLHGLQAGVQIPLFNKSTKQRITAQRIQVDVAQANLEAVRLRTKQELLSVENTIQLYAAGVDYYREQLEIINPEMERMSELNYQAGEISYLELLNTLNLLSKNNKQYWEQVLAHNKAVVLHDFLSNQ